MDLSHPSSSRIAFSPGHSLCEVESARHMTSFEPIAASPPAHPTPTVQPPFQHRPFSDPSRLAPEDAFLAHSPPRRQHESAWSTKPDSTAPEVDHVEAWRDRPLRRKREKERGRSASRRRKGEWKKLLWVRHPGCMWIHLSVRLLRHPLTWSRS